MPSSLIQLHFRRNSQKSFVGRPFATTKPISTELPGRLIETEFIRLAHGIGVYNFSFIADLPLLEV